MFGKELVAIGEFDENEVKRESVGDIGGALMPGGPLPKNRTSHGILAEVEAAWTGIKIWDYERIAREAFETTKPGVVIIAMGNNKPETVLHAVRRGLVNELIIDLDLKQALEVAAAKELASAKMRSQHK
jgi:hypothetical protein